MPVQITLEEAGTHCSFVPLAVIGYCLTRTGTLLPLWSALDLKMKTCDHSVSAKLQDLLVAILAGCQSLAQVNTRIRPDRVLARAWQRPGFADQSTLSRTLDALQPAHIDQLRAGHLRLTRQHTQLRYHDWRTPLILDVDPTSLITSKQAEGSRKGWVSGQKNRYCRHVIRFTLAGYHESLLSVAYPGHQHGYEYLQPAMTTLLQHWPWSVPQRRQLIIRSDAEQGTDANMRFLLTLHFQLLMKGYSGQRTQAWVQRVPETAWQRDPDDPKRWAAPSPIRHPAGGGVQAWLLRGPGPHGTLQQSMLVSTVRASVFDLWALYDGRGAMEVEIRADKSGLAVQHRRKHTLSAQEGWLVLTDMAHNLLAWLQPWMLAGSAFEHFGPERMVHDLFTIPGRISFVDDRLAHVALLASHPYANEMRMCLHTLLLTFDLE
jgi:hypothetical protein